MSFILPSGARKVNDGNAGGNWKTKIRNAAYNRIRVCGRRAEDRKYASIEDAFKRPLRQRPLAVLFHTAFDLRAVSCTVAVCRRRQEQKADFRRWLSGRSQRTAAANSHTHTAEAAPVMRFSGKGRPQDTCGRPLNVPNQRVGAMPTSPQGYHRIRRGFP